VANGERLTEEGKSRVLTDKEKAAVVRGRRAAEEDSKRLEDHLVRSGRMTGPWWKESDEE
jgi:hypothetical protein